MPLEPLEDEQPAEKTLQLSKEERASFLAQVLAHQTAGRTCPTCRLPNPPEQLVCLRCHTELVNRESTLHLGPSPALPGDKTRPVGDVLIAPNMPITFEIDSSALQLPITAILTIGRQATARDAKTPHIDLTPLGAGEYGVSRLHAEIRRKLMLLYVVDLGSTNGSVLNGRRLYPQAEHLLRNGDKLQLSRLTITVKF